MTKRAKYKTIGHIAVDSSQVIIADPCYVLPNDDDEKGVTYDQVCDEHKDEANGFGFIRLGTPDEGALNGKPFYSGVVTGTGMGDGVYPVVARIIDGRVVGVFINFDPEGIINERQV